MGSIAIYSPRYRIGVDVGEQFFDVSGNID